LHKEQVLYTQKADVSWNVISLLSIQVIRNSLDIT